MVGRHLGLQRRCSWVGSMAHENGDASGRVGHVAHGFSSGGSWRDKRRHAVYMPKVPAGSQEVGRHSALAARRLLQALKHLENVDAGPTHVPALQRPPNAAAPRSAAGLLCEIALQYGPGPPRPYAGAKKVCLRQIGSPLRVGREHAGQSSDSCRCAVLTTTHG